MARVPNDAKAQVVLAWLPNHSSVIRELKWQFGKKTIIDGTGSDGTIGIVQIEDRDNYLCIANNKDHSEWLWKHFMAAARVKVMKQKDTIRELEETKLTDTLRYGWKRKYVKQSLDLNNFRGDSPYACSVLFKGVIGTRKAEVSGAISACTF